MATLITNRRRFTDSYRADNTAAGAVAGVAAGAVMGLCMMVLSAIGGMGFWHPIELASGMFYGVNAILGGAGPVITGLAVHLVSMGLWGALFGALLPIDQSISGKSTGWGIAYGAACWAVLTYGALPLTNSVMSERVALAPGWWFFSCLAYGLVLGAATPAIRKSISRQIDVVEIEEYKRAA